LFFCFCVSCAAIDFGNKIVIISRFASAYIVLANRQAVNLLGLVSHGLNFLINHIFIIAYVDAVASE